MENDISEYGGKYLFENISASKITPIVKNMVEYMRKGFTPDPCMFIGGSGIGKTWTIERLKFHIENCEVVKFHLTNMSSEVLFGIPYYQDENGTFKNAPYDKIDTIFKTAKYNKNITYIIELEEANRGEQDIINKLFQLVGGRRYNDELIPENILFLMDINPTESRFDNLASFDDAFYRRFMVYYVVMDAVEWLAHAKDIDPVSKKQNIHKYVIDFIKENRYNMLNFVPKGGENYNIIITPANWGRVSEYLYSLNSDEEITSDECKLFINGILRKELGSIFYKYLYDIISSKVFEIDDVLNSEMIYLNNYALKNDTILKIIDILSDNQIKLIDFFDRMVTYSINSDAKLNINQVINFYYFIDNMPLEYLIYITKTSKNKSTLIKLFEIPQGNTNIYILNMIKSINAKITSQKSGM